MNAYFIHWLDEADPVLQDLAYRVINRKPFKSIITSKKDQEELRLALYQELFAAGYNADYYLNDDSSFDLPYDYYRPFHQSNRIQIDLVTKTNQVVELSQVSSLVHSLAGQVRGDRRLFFPKELIKHLEQIPADQLNEQQKLILVAYINERNDVTHNIQERLF